MKLQPPIQPRPPPHSDVVGVLVVSADKMRVAQDILVPHYLILYRVVSSSCRFHRVHGVGDLIRSGKGEERNEL